MQVLQKWGEYAQDVQFILQRSALDKANAPLSPPTQRSKFQDHARSKAQSAEPPAVWKPPPPTSYPGGSTAVVGNNVAANSGSNAASSANGVLRNKETGARLSPDSGRGSDRTGSDSSNSYPDHHSRPSHNG